EGLQTRHVTVEVDIRRGLPAFTIVGLADAAVREARERVRTAILNSGYEFPGRRITANLAPGDVPKAGPGLDLALACAVLAAGGPGGRPRRTVGTGAEHPRECTRGLSAGPRGRARTASRGARARDSRGRWSQQPPQRAPGHGQDDAGPAHPVDAPRAERAGGDRGHAHPEHPGKCTPGAGTQAPVPRPTPLDHDSRSH